MLRPATEPGEEEPEAEEEARAVEPGRLDRDGVQSGVRRPRRCPGAEPSLPPVSLCRGCR